MKKILLSLSISLGLFCFSFTSCLEPKVINEPSYEYTLELNIKNESSSKKSVMAQAYVLYDSASNSEKTALKLYDCEPLTVESKTSDTYTCTIQDALCAPPHLSHIIKIDEKNFAGFDLDNFTLQSDNSSLSEKISAVKTNLGSVDWSKNNFPTLSYENKTFNTENSSEIKIIYEVIIKDDSDILESEKSDFADGIKISVSHSL